MNTIWGINVNAGLSERSVGFRDSYITVPGSLRFVNCSGDDDAAIDGARHGVGCVKCAQFVAGGLNVNTQGML